MEISYSGKTDFKIKVKTGTVLTGEVSLSVLHKGETGKGFVITEPGEYEIEGISVFGYAGDSGVAYVVQAEDLRVLYMGQGVGWSAKLAEEIENIDVLIMAVEPTKVKEAAAVAAKLEPYYVLPYGEGAAKFTQTYEHGERRVHSLSLGRATLPEDLTEVIVFE